MPYIKPEDREKYSTFLDSVKIQSIGELERYLLALLDWDRFELTEDMAPGELNYLITSLIHKSLDPIKPSYTQYDRIMNVLENLIKENNDSKINGTLRCVQLELYRRWVVPYEDLKISENGDVPEPLVRPKHKAIAPKLDIALRTKTNFKGSTN